MNGAGNSAPLPAPVSTACRRSGCLPPIGLLADSLGASGIDDLEEETGPILRGVSVGVGAGVGQRGEDLVEQVAAAGVSELDYHPAAGFTGRESQ